MSSTAVDTEYSDDNEEQDETSNADTEDNEEIRP